MCSIVKNENDNEVFKMEILTEKLTNVIYMNDLLEFYIENNIPINIKKCKYKIRNKIKNETSLRYGRFSMNKQFYDFLVEQKGYYLFIVEHLGFTVSAKLIKAKDLKFSNSISWTTILDKPKFNIKILEGLLWQKKL